MYLANDCMLQLLLYIFWIFTFMPCRQYEGQQQGQVVAVSHAGPLPQVTMASLPLSTCPATAAINTAQVLTSLYTDVDITLCSRC